VGTVTGERLAGKTVFPDGHTYPNLALVSFVVDRSQARYLTTTGVAAIRYEDLLGARVLSIEKGAPGGTKMPVGGGVFYPGQTKQALSLTDLFNGFKPLFNALTPAQANQLAADVVADFQGEGGSITALLTNVARLTQNFSQRDALIGRVIDNLDVVLGDVADHNGDLATLIQRLAALTNGLSADRGRIAASLNGLDAVASSVSNLVKQGEPALHHDIRDLFLVAGTLVRDQHTLDLALKALPRGAAAFTRSLGYGSWLNGYICALTLQNGKLTIPVNVGGKTLHSAVCR
jgi:phospholipid/cholesterol/gamma-HCH transport system substrate-binding protein